jgi:hypothetical protein
MYLKRKLIKALGFYPVPSESLERRESEVLQNFSELGTYSNSQSIAILDPRNGEVQLHEFNKRKFFEVFDVILEPRQGLIYTKQGNLIEQSSNWSPLENYFSFPWNPKHIRKQLRNTKFICLSSSSYWHWLIEDLPAVIFLTNHYPNSEILIAKDAPKYVIDFLVSLKVNYRMIQGPVLVNSLVFVGKGRDSGWPHPTDIEVLKNHGPFLDAKQKTTGKRIYISRRAAKRSPINEEQVEVLFRKYGFEIVKTENLELLKEITLISQANILAGVHGAGLANMVWLEPGSRVIDIANVNYWTESNHRAAHLMELIYTPYIYTGGMEAEISLYELDQLLNSL